MLSRDKIKTIINSIYYVEPTPEEIETLINMLNSTDELREADDLATLYVPLLYNRNFLKGLHDNFHKGLQEQVDNAKKELTESIQKETSSCIENIKKEEMFIIKSIRKEELDKHRQYNEAIYTAYRETMEDLKNMLKNFTDKTSLMNTNIEKILSAQRIGHFALLFLAAVGGISMIAITIRIFKLL